MSKMRRMRRELRANLGKVVGYQIRDGYGASIVPVLERAIRGEHLEDPEFFGALADDSTAMEERDRVSRRFAAPMIIPAGKGGKATALVSVRGMALYDFEYQPFAFSTLLLAQTVTALANDPEIGTIILDIDSPGGVVTGTPEAGDAIFAARKNANVVALINPLAASAAYWIASQASEVVCVPSGDVGSIGVFMMHVDCSAAFDAAGIKPTFIFATDSPHKVEGNMFEPLGDETREYLLGEVDVIMAQFVKAVARGRGVPVSKVLSDFGKGRTLMAPAAKAAGMVDRVATIGVAMARWGISAQSLEGRRRGEDPAPGPNAAGSFLHKARAYDAAKPITHAKVGETSTAGLVVIDEATGDEVTWVTEVNTDEGWLVRHRTDEDGNPQVCHGGPICALCESQPTGEHVAAERLDGQFRIEQRDPIVEGQETLEVDELAFKKDGANRAASARRRLAIERHR